MQCGFFVGINLPPLLLHPQHKVCRFFALLWVQPEKSSIQLVAGQPKIPRDHTFKMAPVIEGRVLVVLPTLGSQQHRCQLLHMLLTQLPQVVEGHVERSNRPLRLQPEPIQVHGFREAVRRERWPLSQ